MSVLVTTVRRLPHLHVEREAPHRRSTGTGRALHARPRRHLGRGRRRARGVAARRRRHVDPAGEDRRRRSPRRAHAPRIGVRRHVRRAACCVLDAGARSSRSRAFDAVAGRDEWHAVGIAAASALDDRDGRRRRVARQRARRWDPALDRRRRHVGTRPIARRRRRAPGARPPDASGDRRRRGVGRAVPQSPTVARRGRATTDGLDRCRTRAASRSSATTSLVTVSDGPWSDAVGRLPRARRRAVRSSGSRAGCPTTLAGNVDTACLATATGPGVALADGGGDVWRSADGRDGLRTRSPSGIGGVTGVAIA